MKLRLHSMLTKLLALASILPMFCLFSAFAAEQETQSLREPTVIEITPSEISPLNAPATVVTPVSELQFHPQVDLQSRNMLEAQGDVSIRGGTFENSGFAVGSLNLFDPQTGHYFAEIPISPFMLGAPQVLTGLENATSGFNSSVGTVAYSLTPIRDRSIVRLGLGDHSTRVGQLYVAKQDLFQSQGGIELGVDAEVGYSESGGTVRDGDHEFQRFSSRLQLRGDDFQTDLLAGYQDKYFQWPYLYAVRELHELVGSSGIESESIRTTLLALHHQHRFHDGSFFEGGAYYRRNVDDYEFDVAQPGLFNPFEHETKVFSASAQGVIRTTFGEVRLSSQILADEIESTALTFGDFSSRTYSKHGLVPTLEMPVSDLWMFRGSAGLVYDYSNRDRRAFSPVSRLALLASGSQRLREIYIEHARSTQLPGYTAIASNPDGGLFRGNQDLLREVTNNYEVGARVAAERFSLRSALFYRRDSGLVDWTFSSEAPSFTSRFANNVDVNTLGTEVFAEYDVNPLELHLGYTYLTKRSDYGDEAVDASFYALNFPKHRALASIRMRFSEQVQLRYDNEYRRQVPNTLRNSSRDFFLSSVAATWSPHFLSGIELALLLENAFDREFEEVPGVPGRGRLFSAFLTWRM